MQTQRISIRERQSQTIQQAAATSIPSSFWKSLDCKVQRSPADAEWTLTAGDRVGISRIKTRDGDFTIEITAKIPDADIFFLADYAFGQRRDPLQLLDFDDPLLAAVRDDPTACLLMWHVRSISTFASRWLRRDYRSVDRVFDGKVKGRILLNRYVSQHLVVGEAATIPCRTNERTQDTPNNRILKAGLRYAAKISHELAIPAAGQAVRKQVAAALPRFAQVTDIDPNPADFRATSTRGPQRHYAGVLHATRNLLSHSYISNETGGIATQSFMWQMPYLFQEAVRGIISTLGNVQLASTSARANIKNADGRTLRSSVVDPDLVMTTGADHYLLLDTKYKEALWGRGLPLTQTGDADTADDASDGVIALDDKQRIKITRADIYQAVAYRQHDKWGDAVSGLLYPVSLPAGTPLPAPMRVDGFGSPIPLLFIDIGPRCAHNLGEFGTALNMLLVAASANAHSVRPPGISPLSA